MPIDADVEVPMRQIRPRTNSPAVLPTPVPKPVRPPARITVDLRDISESRHPSFSDEDRLRRQLAEVRQAVDAVMEQLAGLIDERENLKLALDSLGGQNGSLPSTDDETVVPWGFFDDEL